MFTSASTVCRMAGILPATLTSWQTAALIKPPCAKGYSESQIAQIRVIRALTSSGDTLSEIRTLLNHPWEYRPSGWELRRQELIIHLQFGTDETRARYLWKLYTRYSPDDVLAFVLTPLTGWLCHEQRADLKARCVASLLGHSLRLIKDRQGSEFIKPVLKMAELIKHYPPAIPSLCHSPHHSLKPSTTQYLDS